MFLTSLAGVINFSIGMWVFVFFCTKASSCLKIQTFELSAHYYIDSLSTMYSRSRRAFLLTETYMIFS